MVAFAELYQANGRTLDPQTVGIICPYRAQIAQIKAKLVEAQKANPQLQVDFERCTIDTVERYQGGTKSIVLLSLCLNNPNQLKTLVSLDDSETVDRKLNVALTRAQHHLVIIGNPQIMVLDKYYKLLLDWAKK
jgi:DNA replication ATP-dependent helicase Dna2